MFIKGAEKVPGNTNKTKEKGRVSINKREKEKRR